MPGAQTLSRLNGVVSCVVTVVVCLVVGIMGFQYGPQAFSYVREATTFKPAPPPSFSYEPIQFSTHFEPIQPLGPHFGEFSGQTGFPHSSNDNNRAMREFRP